ncbi:hypothetical protein SAMN05421505_1058 [Sinosporangium album]|uniref:Phosphotransferase enzyme family protein n=2 Tax=Sinosporangium album TaxID=504805 RepID=A0A1G7UXX9_9ACTN|nr:hypothetical protein SAMN05421505_1058 [Sinosporangium album]
MAVTLDTASGRVFVKGMRIDHPEAWTQEREARLSPHVIPLGPRLLWRVAAGGWDLLGFEHLIGRGAEYGTASTDLPLVAAAMTAIGRLPRLEVELVPIEQRWGNHLDDLSLLAGNTLLHTDWNPTNVLITAKGEVRLVDWPWATRGAAWIDPACWVVWLIFAGQTPPEAERWAAKVPAWSTAPARGLDLFATVQARFWKNTAAAHFSPWTDRLRAAATRWAAHRASRP